ncbi:MAG: DoxX family protein [Bacteroidota bacterium]
MKKRSKIIYWIATIWLALGLLSTGAVQLFKGKEGAGGLDSVTQLGYPAYILTLLGVLKMLAVIVLLIPKFPLLKEWTYAGVCFMMTGAIFSHIASGNSFPEILPSLLILILAVISWYFRPIDRKIISIK